MGSEAPPLTPTRPFGGGAEVRFDDGWDALATRFVTRVRAGFPLEIEPELEMFLRRFVLAKARRMTKRTMARGFALDPEDVVQRVFLKLLESPPTLDPSDRPMRRLVRWVSVVAENHVRDFANRRLEPLAPERESESFVESSGQIEARLTLEEIRRRCAEHYPVGLGLFDALGRNPQATSLELARELGTSVANVDQMRSRLRRTLRETKRELPRRKP